VTDRLGLQCGLLADGLAAPWAARAGDNDRSDRFPASDTDDLRDSRLLSLLVPERLGGLGGSFADYVSVAMRLGAASGSSALLFNINASVTGRLPECSTTWRWRWVNPIRSSLRATRSSDASRQERCTAWRSVSASRDRVSPLSARPTNERGLRRCQSGWWRRTQLSMSGSVRGALDAAVAYAQKSIVTVPSEDAELHDVALSSSPRVGQGIGRAEAQVAAAQLLVDDAARRVVVEFGLPDTVRAVYHAKLVAGDTAFAVATSLTEACGLGALSRGEPLERILRDARSGAMMPPSSDISANVLGALALGVDAGVGLGMRPW